MIEPPLTGKSARPGRILPLTRERPKNSESEPGSRVRFRTSSIYPLGVV
jgi:hypothetical protein